MTGLEAFKIVYNNFDYLISDVVIENDDVNICLKTIKEHLPTIKQSLKALEIIKKKTVDIWLIQNKKTLKQYNSMVDESRQLTQEEFNILNEVLK